MSSKLSVSILIAFIGFVAIAGAFDPLPGDGPQPASKTENTDALVMVSVFGGGKQPLAKTIQFLIAGPRDTTITSMRGNESVVLPGRLNLAAESKTVRFRLSCNGPATDVAYIGTLSCSARADGTTEFVKANAISLNITESDLRSASNGVVTQFIFLPHRHPTEKWAGHLGRLTMGSVTSKQRDELLENIKRRGQLLSEFSIVSQDLVDDDVLRDFPATPKSPTNKRLNPSGDGAYFAVKYLKPVGSIAIVAAIGSTGFGLVMDLIKNGQFESVVNTLMYTCIYIFASAETLHNLYRKFKITMLAIITRRQKEVGGAITKTSAHRTYTMHQGTGGHSGDKFVVVRTIITHEELPQVFPIAHSNAAAKPLIQTIKQL